MSETIAHVVVRGLVQGVGYRAFVEDEAAMIGLEGWVRNRRDGSVEAVFSGDAKDVAAMIEVCRKGPEPARVDAVEQRAGTGEQLAMRHAGEHFSVLPTA